MSITEHIITIAIISLGTMLTRFLPFMEAADAYFNCRGNRMLYAACAVCFLMNLV